MAYSPCGIHEYKRHVVECVICLRVQRELAEESMPKQFTVEERESRRRSGKISKLNGSPFQQRSRNADGDP